MITYYNDRRYNIVSRISNVIVLYQTPIIAEYDAVIIVT